MNDDNIDHESLPLLRRLTTTSSCRRSQAVERARDHDHVMLQIATVTLEDRTSQQRRRERLPHYMIPLRFLRLGRCTAKENSCELSGRPTGGGWAAACLHKHRRYEPGRPKGASPAAVVTSLVAKLTPTLLPAG